MAATDATPINPLPNAGDAANNEPTFLLKPIHPVPNVEGSHTIPNILEPGQPLLVVTFHNTKKLTSSNYLTWKIQLEAILIGYDLEHFIYGMKLRNLKKPFTPPRELKSCWHHRNFLNQTLLQNGFHDQSTENKAGGLWKFQMNVFIVLVGDLDTERSLPTIPNNAVTTLEGF
nr:Retrovirus-related Pol polyprotein from transposon RE1 [Ipomoea batatas]